MSVSDTMDKSKKSDYQAMQHEEQDQFGDQQNEININNQNKTHCCEQYWTENWFPFFLTSSFIRYLTVAILVIIYNYKNHTEIKGYNKYCCSCYYLSLHHKDSDFDLSNCIPVCTDCNYCQTFFDHSAQNAYNYTDSDNQQCPLGQYKDTTFPFELNWSHVTGCPNNVHISSLFLFETDYISYGNVGIFWIVLYFIVIIVMLFVGYFRSIVDTGFLSKTLIIFNGFISEMYLYLFFIPARFYHKKFNVGRYNAKIICEIDSVSHKWEILINVFTWIAIGLFACHLFFAIYMIWKVFLKEKCCQRLNYQPPATQVQRNELIVSLNLSISQDQNNNINHDDEQNDVDNEQNNVDDNKPRIFPECCEHFYCAIIISIIYVLFGVVYFFILVLATIFMIIAGRRNHEFIAWKETFVIIVNTLLATTIIDYVVGFLTLFGFCRKQRN